MTQTLTFDLARPWRTHPRETVGLVVLALVAATPLAEAAWSTQRLPTAEDAAIPAAPDMSVRPVAPRDALAINEKIPLYTGPNPPALPFSMAKAGKEARARALECLTSAIYYEAAQEPTEGQLAVAQVVLNRVRHPAFPASVCGVVYEGSTRITGCQFTFTCDGSMTRAPMPALWNRARKVAEAALNGAVAESVGNATHYHANYVVPYWASSLAKTDVIGTHLFYRWQGNWGRPAAFTQRYAGKELSPAALRTAALAVNRTAPVIPEQAAEVLAEIRGTTVTEDGKRVRVLFTPQAREAVEKVKVTPYVERAKASDNLRFALNGAAPAETERPFGTSSGEGTQPTTSAPPPSAALGASPN